MSSSPSSSGDVVHGGIMGQVETPNIMESCLSTGTATHTTPSLVALAVMVCAPLVGYYIFLELGAFGIALLLFCMATFFAILCVLLSYMVMGELILPPPCHNNMQDKTPSVGDTITCVDLNGMHHFIAKAKKYWEEWKLAHKVITTVHLVARAMAEVLP